jgi:hypothetical protein
MNPLIATLMTRAFDGVETEPADVRADLFEAAAELLRSHCPEEAETARKTAAAIREAEQLQLHFRNLFTDEGRGA